MPRLNETLRLCLFKGMPTAFEYRGAAEAIFSKGPRYEGPIADTFNTISQIIFGPYEANYTVEFKESMGILNRTSGYYDKGSCQYSMQVNESYLGLAITPHPLIAKRLKVFPPYFSDNTYLLSHYIISKDTKSVDFVQAFADIFSIEVWICFALFSFVFWLLVKLHLRYINEGRMRDDAMYEILTHLFQVETIDYEGPSMRVTSFFVTLLSFYVIGYFTMSMKTDIVVVPEPFVVRSYADLLSQPRIKLVFPKLIDNSLRFEFAKPGSTANQLWLKSLKEFNGSRNAMFVTFGGTNVNKVMRDMVNVLMDPDVIPAASIPEIAVKAARKLGCMLKNLLVMRKLFSPSDKKAAERWKRRLDVVANLHYWTSKDPDSKEYILNIAYSAYYKSPYAQQIYKRSSWASALGVMALVARNLDRPPTNAFQIDGQREGDAYRACLTENYRSNMPHPEFDSFGLAQFITLFYTYSALVISAAVALIWEKRRKFWADRLALITDRRRRRTVHPMARWATRVEQSPASQAMNWRFVGHRVHTVRAVISHH